MDVKQLLKKVNPKSIPAILIAGFVIFAIIILIAFFAARSPKTPKPVYFEREEIKKSTPGINYKPGVEDLKIPKKYSKAPDFTWQQFRTVPENWSEDEIQRFWQNPADIIIEYNAEENRNAVEKILEDIP